MAIVLKASNKNLIKNAKYSYLNTNYASGVSAIVVVNSIGFAADDYVLLGEFGQERSEVVKVSSVTAATHTLNLTAVTTFSHAESTKATIIPYNQVRFYRTTTTTSSTNPANAVTGYIDIQPDSLYTVASDTTNITGYGWFVFYNATTTNATTVSNYIPYADFSANTAKKILDEFFHSLGQKDSKLISVSDAFVWLSEGYSIVQTELNAINREYKATISAEQDTTSGTSEYAFPDNASEIISVWDEDNDKEIEECDLRDVNKHNSSALNETQYYVRGEYIGFTPQPNSTVTYKISYLSKTVPITSLTDTIDLPDNNYHMLKDFLRFRAAPILKYDGTLYYELFNKAIERMKVSAVKRTDTIDSFSIAPSANV